MMGDQRITTTGGGERVVSGVAIDKFASQLRGQLLRPESQGYDSARKVWNGMIDKRPALIARCTGTADVIECVRFAREHDTLLAVRGGGHSVPGFSMCDGGLVVDLSAMRSVRVDPVQGTEQWVTMSPVFM